MDSLDFPEIAEILNHSRTTKIEKTPSRQQPHHWALYSGEYKVHTATTPFEVLYLYSKATRESMEAALRVAFKAQRTQVVYAPSLDERTKVHRELFEGKAQGFWTTKDYLASFIKEEMDVYLSKVRALAPAFYIDPQVETPSGFTRKMPNPLLSLLTDPDPGVGMRDGILGIVLAEPGQGKTYMSRHISATLAERGFIPIYIDSTQWSSIPRDDLDSLAKTITHSFRHFEATIGWLEGCEEKFLRATLKAGLFRIIFDGFDEYVQWNRGKFSAQEVIQNISQLVSATGARILVTSRTSFWHSDLPDEAAFAAKDAPVRFYEILPFEQQQAKNYFDKRFNGDEGMVKRAVTLYSSLREQDRELVGRGFVLNLVADLSSREESPASPVPGGVGALEWVIEKLCEREHLRQRLPVTGKEQIGALRNFVAEIAQGEEPSSEMLELALAASVQTLDENSARDCVRKMRVHPLLRFDSEKDRWDLAEEQVRYVLLADHLLTLIKAGEQGRLVLANFVAGAKFEGNLGGDLAAMVVDVIRGRGQVDAEKALREVVHSLLSAEVATESAHQQRSLGARGLAVAIALRTVERLLPKGSSHLDRTQLFRSMFPRAQLRLLPFSGSLGTISRMDFSGVLFEQCRFDAVVWANCKFDDAAVFDRCHFIGGAAMHCNGLGSVQWRGGTRDHEASAWINSERVKAGRRAYTADDLQADIRALLNKFVVRGGVGFRSVEESNLKAGTVSGSKYRDEIVEEMLLVVLEVHEISGRSEKGCNVRDDAKEAVRFYAANNVLTGPLQKAFEKLVRKLRLEQDV